MIRDLIAHGVEVVDLYPHFWRRRENNRLFSLGHEISCTGAELTGNILGTYLLDTTDGIVFQDYHRLFAAQSCSAKEDNIEYQTEQLLYDIAASGKPYQGLEIASEIGIFGNCNLQKYRKWGGGVTAQLTNFLSYPVNYLGRLLPFDSSGAAEFANAPDGVFAGKKIVIYLGFPSAAFVRAIRVDGVWAVKAIPERCF